MCENRDGKVVVPEKPSAGIGFWIGRPIGAEKSINKMSGQKVASYQVALSWVQHPEHNHTPVLSTSGPFVEFDDEGAAMAHLKARGIA
jgi:hypothetical protein